MAAGPFGLSKKSHGVCILFTGGTCAGENTFRPAVVRAQRVRCSGFRLNSYTTPWASMAWLIFKKLATLAPTTRLPGLPTATEAS